MKNFNGNEVLFNALIGNTKDIDINISEEEQRKGFQYGNSYVVGKTYQEYKNDIRQIITINFKSDVLSFLYEI